MFLDIIERTRCEAIVETGTYCGTTTLFLASVGLLVYSGESNPRSYAYSRLRLFRYRDRIRLYEGDSRDFLRLLSRDETFPRGRVFFYLDAHWSSNLPLREELEIIFTVWPAAVVMVDDFHVPGTDYGYDDYGAAGTLRLEFLEPLRHLQLAPFFPSMAPEVETGGKRGCVVFCQGGDLERVLSGIETLRAAYDVRS